MTTGHSLGAGAAALVALYIRSFYPKSRAWAFEPPGGLVDGQLARASSDCITSVVLGKDWVPRLSISSFERLRDEMVSLSCQSRHSLRICLQTLLRCENAGEYRARADACHGLGVPDVPDSHQPWTPPPSKNSQRGVC